MVFQANIITATICLLVLIVAGIGGAAVVTDDLSFKEYAESVATLSIGVGLVGIGRGASRRAA